MKLKFLLPVILILFAAVSCRTQKGTQSNNSQVKATAESATQTVKQTTTNLQSDNTQQDSATSNEQHDYERETAISQTPILDNTGKQIGTNTYTVIKEKGKKTIKKSTTTKQTKKKNKAVKENQTSDHKSKANSDSTAKAKQTTTTRTGGGGGSIWLTLIIIAIILTVIIIAIVKRKLKTLPIPLLCIAILLFPACEQKVETPVVAIAYKQPAKYLTLLDIARKEIGVKEIPTGSNWGGDIPKYLESVGIKFPAPWCMAYVYWVVDQYSKQYNLQNPLYKTGHVLTQWRKCKALRVDKPQPGDICVILNLDKKGRPNGTGHCFFADSLSVNGDNIYTIEGNTNTDGSRNGYMVCQLIRRKTTITGFIRLVFKQG